MYNNNNDEIRLTAEEERLIGVIVEEGLDKITKNIKSLYPDDYLWYTEYYIDTVNMNNKLLEAVKRLYMKQ